MKDYENSSDDKEEEHELQYRDWHRTSSLHQAQKEASRAVPGIMKRSLDSQFDNN